MDDLALAANEDGARIGGTATKDKGYGGFTFRFNDAEDKQVNIEGRLMEKDENQTQARWIDWTGVSFRVTVTPRIIAAAPRY